MPYKLGVVGRMLTVDEKDLIKGLQSFNELTGKYPSKLDSNTVIPELVEILKAKAAKGEIDSAKMNVPEKEILRDKVMDVFFASMFWKTLGSKQPYYMSCVNEADKDKVLASWQVSKNKRRVIYGGLIAETIDYEKMQNEYTKVLSNGAIIQFLGVCNYPSKGKQWWNADGTPLGYAIETHDDSNYKSNDPGYEFAIKISGAVAEFKIGQIKDSGPSSDIKTLSPSDGTHARRAHINKNINKTELTVHYLTDKAKWETIGEHNGNGTNYKYFKGSNIIFSQANDTSDGVVITVTDNLKNRQAISLIAIDKNGKEIPAQHQTALMVNNMSQQSFIFKNMKKADIKNYKYQQAPYESVVFKDISLKPKA
ncbi:MAG: hypothetical protein ABFD79_02130 [Phycisphaerales bacterium]